MSINKKVPKELKQVQNLVWLTVATFFIITYSELSNESSVWHISSLLAKFLVVLLFCAGAKILNHFLCLGNNLARISVLLLTIKAIYISLSGLELGSFREIPITAFFIYITFLLFSKPLSNYFK